MYAHLSLCMSRRTVHLSIALCAWVRDVVACLRGRLLSHSVWCAVSTVCRTGGGGMAPCIQGVKVCWLVVCVWKWDCSEGCATENECGSRWCLW